MKTLLFLLTLLVPAWGASETLSDIEWMSEQYPPYNYVDENGTPKGVTFEVLFEVFDKVGHDMAPSDIDFLPWARSYRTLQEEPNTALFSMTYTPEREKLFRFVGPIIPSVVGVIAKKSANLEVAGPADLNSLRIGAIRDDIGHQMLESIGVEEKAIHLTSNTGNMLKMLINDRVDAIAYGDDIARWHLKNMGENTTDFEVAYTLKEGEMGYAFHKETDPAILQKLQKALDELKADGTVERIAARYLK